MIANTERTVFDISLLLSTSRVLLRVFSRNGSFCTRDVNKHMSPTANTAAVFQQTAPNRERWKGAITSAKRREIEKARLNYIWQDAICLHTKGGGGEEERIRQKQIIIALLISTF